MKKSITDIFNKLFPNYSEIKWWSDSETGEDTQDIEFFIDNEDLSKRDWQACQWYEFCVRYLAPKLDELLEFYEADKDNTERGGKDHIKIQIINLNVFDGVSYNYRACSYECCTCL